MSEILSENELQMIEDLHRYSDTGQSRTIRHLIASHRAVQAERDALKAQLDQRTKDYKQLIADQCEEDTEFREKAGADDHSSSYGMEPYVEILKRVQQERDALKAELAHWTFESFKQREDALKAELEFHKQAALNFIDLSAELRKERDTLGQRLREVCQSHGTTLIHMHALEKERDALKTQLNTAQDLLAEQQVLAGRAMEHFEQHIDALKAELAEEKWKCGDFETAPCFICGYGGQGYYQPDTHPCASEYHRRREAKL